MTEEKKVPLASLEDKNLEKGYELAAKTLYQADVSWQQTNDLFFKILTLSAPLILSVPAISKYIPEMSFDSDYHGVITGCFVINLLIGLVGRLLGTKSVLDLETVWSTHLQKCYKRFMVDIIQHSYANAQETHKTIDRKYWALRSMVVLLGIQAAALSCWMLTYSSCPP